MGKVLSYLKQMMEDSAGSPSSKRLVTILATLLVCGAFVANLGWGLTVEEFMYNNMMYIVIAGLGITGAEKFAPRAPTKED
jgi:hypothetical protein